MKPDGGLVPLEAQQLVMNLAASNSSQQEWQGDMQCLPLMDQWRQIVLPGKSLVRWSWEALK
eukprot:8752269-Karenia_brevis.AAC.1